MAIEPLRVIEIGLWVAIVLAILLLISGYMLSFYLESKRSKTRSEKILHDEFDEAVSPKSVTITSATLVAAVAMASIVSIPSLNDSSEGAVIGAFVGALGGAVGPFSYAADRPKSGLWKSLTFWIITVASSLVAAVTIFGARKAFTHDALRLTGVALTLLLLFFLLRERPWNEPTWQWPGRLIWSGFGLMFLIALVGISAAFGAF